jgi:hypothetical protein
MTSVDRAHAMEDVASGMSKLPVVVARVKASFGYSIDKREELIKFAEARYAYKGDLRLKI